jgi:hypothetical protein
MIGARHVGHSHGGSSAAQTSHRFACAHGRSRAFAAWSSQMIQSRTASEQRRQRFEEWRRRRRV